VKSQFIEKQEKMLWSQKKYLLPKSWFLSDFFIFFIFFHNNNQIKIYFYYVYLQKKLQDRKMFFAQLIWAILRIYFSHIADSVKCFLFARDFMNPTDPHESLVLICVQIQIMKQILMDNPQIWICKSDSMDSFLVIIEKSNLVNLQIWSFQKSLIHLDALGFESRNLSFFSIWWFH
jgi:hypothetical protein